MKFSSCLTIGAAALLLSACAASTQGDGEPGSSGDPNSGGASKAKGGSGQKGAGGTAGSGMSNSGTGGGLPGKTDGGAAVSPGDMEPPSGPVPATTTVVISEIMYHAVKEDSDDELHEFVEIFNRSAKVVSLEKWRLESGANGVKFEFPAGAMIAPGQYRVIAKNKKATATVWALLETELFGDYSGELENKGDTLVLTDAMGAVIDQVKFDDRLPWPLSADALGVGEEWLPPTQRPITKHQYKGRSLERLSNDWASSDPANWDASALDGSTPGKVNGVAGPVKPIALQQGINPEGGTGLIVRAKDKVVVTAQLSAFAKVEGAEIRYFYDVVTKSDEPREKATMTADVAGTTWTVTLPAKADGTLVRYQVWATRMGKLEQVSPRTSDPIQWNAYFVTPDIKTTSRTYQLFITPEDWTRLENWLAIGRIPANENCIRNAGWDENVPATFIYEGEVFDVVAAYSGSRYQRRNGAPIPNWKAPGPKLPGMNPLLALSWKVKFPKFKEFEKASTIKLNKQYQGFPGTVTWVESKLFEAANLPTYKVRFDRLYINGAYYHYVAETEQVDEKMMSRYAAKGQVVGDMFKNDAPGGDEGPAAKGDLFPIGMNAKCPQFNLAARYEATYPRVNYDYRGYGQIMKLVTDLDAAAKKGNVSPEVKAYFEANWDVDQLAKSMAIRNWSGVWDDTFHNMYFYKQPSNGKWILIQQDFEWDFGLGRFGGEQGLGPWRSDVTLYIGSFQDQPIGKTCELPIPPPPMTVVCNSLGFSRLKNLFIQNFKTKFDDTMKALVKDVLSPGNVLKVIEAGVKEFKKEDWDAAPASKIFCGAKRDMMCSVDAVHEAMVKWTNERAAVVSQRLP